MRLQAQARGAWQLGAKPFKGVLGGDVRVPWAEGVEQLREGHIRIDVLHEHPAVEVRPFLFELVLLVQKLLTTEGLGD